MLRSMAVANDAEWCNLVWRTHGLETRFDEDAWTSRTRAPRYYPDAVTLVPEPSVPDLLARVDASPGCSIKDSFASLDLATYGFRVLFDAEWIVRAQRVPRSDTPTLRWDTVRNPDTFADWERAWRGFDGPPDVLLADLLREDAVTVLSAYVGDRVAGGAILNRRSDAVGISNLFVADPAGPADWDGCVAFACSLFPESSMVGYASGTALDAARGHGINAVGPLRVWIRGA